MISSIRKKELLFRIAIFVCGMALGLFATKTAKPGNRPSTSAVSVHQLAMVPATKPGADDSLNLDPTSIQSLCEKRMHAVMDTLRTDTKPQRKSSTFDEQGRQGIQKMQRLLPLAKRLVIQEFRSRGYRNRSMEQRIMAVTTIARDNRISEVVEVDDRFASKIFVAPDVMGVFTSEDTTILVLAHELTHVAARHKDLRDLIDSVAQTARVAGDVNPTNRQKEDLACDFIGAEVLKRFVRLRPTTLTTKERLSQALGVEDAATRLQRSLDEFCSAYDDDLSDEEHLGADQTLRALIANDPELQH